MALPTVKVRSLNDLKSLRGLVGPHSVQLPSIDAVREAPLLFAQIKEKEMAGWTCDNIYQLDLAARFANQLAKLEDDVFPSLLRDPHDRSILRRLRSCGQAILRVRQTTSSGSGVFDLAGNFSNCLIRIARQALDKTKPYTVNPNWICGKVRGVQKTRASPVIFVAAPVGPAAPPLPAYVVTKLDDVVGMDFLVAAGGREIDLVCIHSLRDAALYFSVIEQKVSEGWICNNLSRLHQAQRFADRLARLGDAILPNLVQDAEDRTTLRELRSCGRGIWKIRRHSDGLLFDMMGRYTNSLTRTARQALNRNKRYNITPDWVYDMMALVDKDLLSTIMF